MIHKSSLKNTVAKGIKLFTLVVLQIHSLNGIFCPNHQNSLLYIPFFRTYPYSISLSIPTTTGGTHTTEFFSFSLFPLLSLSLPSPLPRRPFLLGSAPPAAALLLPLPWLELADTTTASEGSSSTRPKWRDRGGPF